MIFTLLYDKIPNPVPDVVDDILKTASSDELQLVIDKIENHDTVV